jgi:hypothetical protein
MSPDDIALVASQQKLNQPTNLNVTVKERATKIARGVSLKPLRS